MFLTIAIAYMKEVPIRVILVSIRCPNIKCRVAIYIRGDVVNFIVSISSCFTSGIVINNSNHFFKTATIISGLITVTLPRHFRRLVNVRALMVALSAHTRAITGIRLGKGSLFLHLFNDGWGRTVQDPTAVWYT